MDNLIKIKQKIKQHKKELENKYKVKEIGVFGSCVRGEERNNMDLEEHLEDLLGGKVDLVSKKALKPRIGQYILKEGIYEQTF